MKVAWGRSAPPRTPNSGREVAIKVLPKAFAGEQERFCRFEREAHVLASLNHPNISPVSGSAADQEHPLPGAGAGGGRNFATRLSRGPIAVADVLPLALQIAEAMEDSARGKGIVHRDLKPADVMVDPDDKIRKSFDFGLAGAGGGAGKSGQPVDVHRR